MQTMSYSSSDQWPQYYHHQQIPYHQQPSMPNSDTTAMDYESNLYPIESNTNGSNPDCHLKAPIKRKSRASKRVPTTIFNADVGNFRALVQQLTGRPRGPVGSHRGPVNINFSKGNADDYHNHHDVGGVRSHAMMMPLDGCNYYGSNSISRGSIKLRNDEENGGNGFVKNHQDMVLCSNNGWQNTAATPTSTSCGSKVDDHELDEFDDFDVDELCLEELEWVASGDL